MEFGFSQDFSQDLSGFLDKRNRRGMFNMRFFRTQRKCISYWKVKNKASKPIGEPSATYPLAEVKVISTAEDRFFHILFKDGIKIHLRAANTRQRDAWVTVLRAKVKYAQCETCPSCNKDNCLSFISPRISALHTMDQEDLISYINDSLNEAFDSNTMEEGALKAVEDIRVVRDDAEVEIENSCEHEPRLRAFSHSLVDLYARLTGGRLLLELSEKYSAGRSLGALHQDLSLEELRQLFCILVRLEIQARRCLEFGSTGLQDAQQALLSPVVVAAAVEAATVQKAESLWANLMSKLAMGAAGDGLGEEATSARYLLDCLVAELVATAREISELTQVEGYEADPSSSGVEVEAFPRQVASEVLETLVGLLTTLSLEKVIPQNQWGPSLPCVCRFGASCLRVPRGLQKACGSGGVLDSEPHPVAVADQLVCRIRSAAVACCQSAFRFVAQVYHESALVVECEPLAWTSVGSHSHVREWLCRLSGQGVVHPACGSLRYLLVLGVAEVAVVNRLHLVFSRLESKQPKGGLQKMTGVLTRASSFKKHALSEEELDEMLEDLKALQAFLHTLHEQTIYPYGEDLLGLSSTMDCTPSEDVQFTRILMLPTWVKSFLQMDEEPFLTMFAQAIGSVDEGGRPRVLALAESCLRLRPDFSMDRARGLLVACESYLEQAPSSVRMERSDRLLAMLRRVVSAPPPPPRPSYPALNFQRAVKVPDSLVPLVAELSGDPGVHEAFPRPLLLFHGHPVPLIERLLEDFDAADTGQQKKHPPVHSSTLADPTAPDMPVPLQPSLQNPGSSSGPGASDQQPRGGIQSPGVQDLPRRSRYNVQRDTGGSQRKGRRTFGGGGGTSDWEKAPPPPSKPPQELKDVEVDEHGDEKQNVRIDATQPSVPLLTQHGSPHYDSPGSTDRQAKNNPFQTMERPISQQAVHTREVSSKDNNTDVGVEFNTCKANNPFDGTSKSPANSSTLFESPPDKAQGPISPSANSSFGNPSDKASHSSNPFGNDSVLPTRQTRASSGSGSTASNSEFAVGLAGSVSPSFSSNPSADHDPRSGQEDSLQQQSGHNRSVQEAGKTQHSSIANLSPTLSPPNLGRQQSAPISANNPFGGGPSSVRRVQSSGNGATSSGEKKVYGQIGQCTERYRRVGKASANPEETLPRAPVGTSPTLSPPNLGRQQSAPTSANNPFGGGPSSVRRVQSSDNGATSSGEKKVYGQIGQCTDRYKRANKPKSQSTGKRTFAGGGF